MDCYGASEQVIQGYSDGSRAADGNSFEIVYIARLSTPHMWSALCRSLVISILRATFTCHLKPERILR